MAILDDILASTRTRVAELSAAVKQDVLEQRIASQEPVRPFGRALRGPRVAVVAEIKRFSPTKGALNPTLNAGELAAAYARGGAAAISVLTEPDHFQGSMEDLKAARGAGLPVLRKDFIIEEFQLLEARAWGADAVLLIVRILGDELGALNSAARALGMDVLVEVHDETDLERALALRPDLIGVNHRDLATFEVDVRRTAKLAPLIPDDVTVVALSGVTRRAEVDELAAAGAHAVLVGESLVTAPDPGAALAELVGAS